MSQFFEPIEGPRVLDPMGLRALMRTPDRRTRLGKRDAALLAILCLGGLRVGECRTLRIGAVEEAGQGILRLRFQTLKRRNHWRVISLAPIGARPLRAWLKLLAGHRTDWLFPGACGGPLTTRAVEKRVARYLAAIGFPDLHLHSLRHSALTTLMRQTGDLHRVQRMAGHASPTTTAQAYLSWSAGEADENAAAMAAALAPRRRNRARP